MTGIGHMWSRDRLNNLQQPAYEGALQEAPQSATELARRVAAGSAQIRYMATAESSRGSGLGIRVGVRTSGCSGMAYVLEFVHHVTKMQTFRRHQLTNILQIWSKGDRLERE